jgi:hypothetical protein
MLLLFEYSITSPEGQNGCVGIELVLVVLVLVLVLVLDTLLLLRLNPVKVRLAIVSRDRTITFFILFLV